MKKLGIVCLLPLMILSAKASADQYSCAKMVYKDGWLTKYEHLGNTWGANTKKHGVVSSSVGSSVEKTTSSVDPGVITGQFMSSVQYTSSWGECSILEMNITQKMREDYIEQNMPEIKRQIAIGYGYHVDALAFVSGCRQLERAEWSRDLQKNTASLYDIKDGRHFSKKLDNIIKANASFKVNCHIPLG